MGMGDRGEQGGVVRCEDEGVGVWGGAGGVGDGEGGGGAGAGAAAIAAILSRSFLVAIACFLCLSARLVGSCSAFLVALATCSLRRSLCTTGQFWYSCPRRPHRPHGSSPSGQSRRVCPSWPQESQRDCWCLTFFLIGCHSSSGSDSSSPCLALRMALRRRLLSRSSRVASARWRRRRARARVVSAGRGGDGNGTKVLRSRRGRLDGTRSSGTTISSSLSSAAGEGGDDGGIRGGREECERERIGDDGGPTGWSW